jgi:cell division protein FtsZ
MYSSLISSDEKPSYNNAHRPILKVVGLGGGGCNAITRMMEFGLRGVDFIAANTDRQALAVSPAETKIRLGPELTRGLGAGGDPGVGNAAARESHLDLAEAMKGADMVFLTAGMGGGTGTGAIPVAAEIARSQGAVTIAIVTTPFSFEMGRRQKNASQGLALLQNHTDTLISIPNDRLLMVAPRDLPMETAFCLADDVLRQAVQGITELITEPGIINIDFAHIRRMMKLGGGALMAIGQGRNEGKVQQAVKKALHHPLLNDISIENAAGIIANFTGGSDMTLVEVSEALEYLQDQTGTSTEIVMGAITDEHKGGLVEVILIVTGIGASSLQEILPGSEHIGALGQNGYTNDNTEPAYQMPTYGEQAEPAEGFDVGSQSLDIPAFMRRRSRFSDTISSESSHA